MIINDIFFKVILPSKCYFMPKELHPNRQLWFYYNDLYLSSFGMQGFERGSFPLWLNKVLVKDNLSCQIKHSVSHPPPSRRGLFRLFPRKTWWLSLPWELPWKPNHFHKSHRSFLVLPHNPRGGSSLLTHGCCLDKPETIPLTLEAAGATMASASQVPRLIPLTYSEMATDVTQRLVFWVASSLLFPFPSQDLLRQPGAQLASLGWGWRFLPGDP